MHLKTLKMIATSGFLTALECTNFVFGPDPAGGAHDAPPDPLVGSAGEGDTPPHSPPPRRLRRLGLVAYGDSIVDSPPAVVISPPNAWGSG